MLKKPTPQSTNPLEAIPKQIADRLSYAQKLALQKGGLLRRCEYCFSYFVCVDKNLGQCGKCGQIPSGLRI